MASNRRELLSNADADETLADTAMSRWFGTEGVFICDHCYWKSFNQATAMNQPLNSFADDAESQGHPQPRVFNSVAIFGGVFLFSFIVALAITQRGEENHIKKSGPDPNPTKPSPGEGRNPHPGSLAGGVWVEYNSGSKILRGIEVRLLRKTMQQEEIQRLLPRIKERLVGGEGLAASIDIQVLENRINDISRPIMIAFMKIIEANPLGDNTTNEYLKILQDLDLAWITICAFATEARTRSDIEGKYLFSKIPKGDYYVYATYDISSKADGEWFVPVSINSGEVQKLDLTNYNFRVMNSR